MYPAARGGKGAIDDGGRASTVTATPDAASFTIHDGALSIFYGHDASKDAAERPKKRLSPDDATKSRKKTKRRKKEQEVETRAIVSKNENGKRIKHEVDETKTPDVEQETYSTLVETFRTTMTRRAQDSQGQQAIDLSIEYLGRVRGPWHLDGDQVFMWTGHHWRFFMEQDEQIFCGHVDVRARWSTGEWHLRHAADTLICLGGCTEARQKDSAIQQHTTLPTDPQPSFNSKAKIVLVVLFLYMLHGGL
ncbi:hypothetical protein PsorP6_004265 [Peronosclerospora sorghi]|uniref:Uncharacterized protein n=1 Tax=Peronosclerospora sorghi TaxID=230839 RepID=A0ACC0VLQ8_9STRA|nr:hypothetical protein PsorP6_004265 [Peronosclerospora sorghi]